MPLSPPTRSMARPGNGSPPVPQFQTAEDYAAYMAALNSGPTGMYEKDTIQSGPHKGKTPDQVYAHYLGQAASQGLQSRSAPAPPTSGGAPPAREGTWVSGNQKGSQIFIPKIAAPQEPAPPATVPAPAAQSRDQAAQFAKNNSEAAKGRAKGREQANTESWMASMGATESQPFTSMAPGGRNLAAIEQQRQGPGLGQRLQTRIANGNLPTPTPPKLGPAAQALADFNAAPVAGTNLTGADIKTGAAGLAQQTANVATVQTKLADAQNTLKTQRAATPPPTAPTPPPIATAPGTPGQAPSTPPLQPKMATVPGQGPRTPTPPPVATAPGTPGKAPSTPPLQPKMATVPGQGPRTVTPPRITPKVAANLPKRAEGGPVTAGQPYLVGEKGPEVVVPKPSATSQAIMGVVHAGGNLAKGAAGLVSMAAEAKLEEADDFDTGKTKPSNFVPISERYKDEPWYKQIPKQLRDSLLLSPSDPQVIQQFKHTTGGWASAAREPIQAIKQRADKEHVAATNTQTALEPQLGNVGQATSFAASLTPGARALDIPAAIGAAKSLKGGIVPAIATAVTRKLPGGELAKNSAQQAIGAIMGARAEGGPVTAGQPYLVGEKGPEVVVPQTSGTVIPNKALHAEHSQGMASERSFASNNLGMPTGTPSRPSRPLSNNNNWRMPTSPRTAATWKPQPPRLLAIN